MNAIQIGDYVVATKYHDGDPKDHWVVGFYAGLTNAEKYDPPRYDVVDSNGKQFRGNGFRRMEKITQEQGANIVQMMPQVEQSGQPVWDFVAELKKGPSCPAAK